MTVRLRLLRRERFAFELVAVVPRLQVSDEVVHGYVLHGVRDVHHVLEHLLKGVLLPLVVGLLTGPDSLLVETEDIDRSLFEVNLSLVT